MLRPSPSGVALSGLCCLTLLSLAPGAQTPGPNQKAPPKPVFTPTNTTAMYRTFTPILNGPYSADRVSESVETLPDGSHVTTRTTSREYRDSLGRTRSEHQTNVYQPAARNPTWVVIRNPAAGVSYILELQSKLAHRVAMNHVEPGRQARDTGFRIPEQSLAGRAKKDRKGVLTEIEDLGAQVIEGVLAKGMRQTETYPPGALFGGRINDRPYIRTHELWQAVDSGVDLVFKSSEGSSTSAARLTNFSTAEPDLGLFQPPPDFKIVDETGETFTLHFTPL